jgi:hypothetical protein
MVPRPGAFKQSSKPLLWELQLLLRKRPSRYTSLSQRHCSLRTRRRRTALSLACTALHPTNRRRPARRCSYICSLLVARCSLLVARPSSQLPAPECAGSRDATVPNITTPSPSPSPTPAHACAASTRNEDHIAPESALPRHRVRAAEEAQ